MKTPTRKLPTLGDLANYMQESRLEHVEQEKDGLKQAVYHEEQKLPKTNESLEILGANKPYGG